MRFRSLAVLAVAAAVAAPLVVSGQGPAAPDRAIVTVGLGGAEILEIDLATGDRRAVNLEDYPVVLTVKRAAIAPDGTVIVSAINAAQGVVLLAYAPDTGTVSGVSGYVDRTSDVPRGAGPDLQPGLGALAFGRWGTLFVLREFAGPMRVDIATGDRAYVSQSVAPAVGAGVPLWEPVDMTVLSDGSLLLAERLGGLVRVDPRTGVRILAHTFPDIVEAVHRLGRLPDGRVVHAVGQGDGREVSVFDADLSARTVVSGEARGAGAPFAGISDLAVAPDGTIYVLDSRAGALVAVDPVTGDRTVVSGGPEGRGAGPELPGPEWRPALARFAVPDRPGPRPPRRLLRSNG